MKCGVAAFCLVWLAASAVGAQTAKDDWRVERLERTFEVRAGQAIEVINAFGDVRVRGGRNQEVYVLAVVQRHADDARAALVSDVEGRDGRFIVEVGYPDSAGAETVPEAWQNRRVDLAVFLPASAPASLSTQSGEVEVKGLRGNLEISTARGGVFARTAGRLVARSEHGSILAQLRRTDGIAVSRLETVTGSIRVELPRDQQLSTVLETRGEITTDYSLVIERQSGSRLKRARTLPTGDSRQLELKSYQGAIGLMESLVPEDDEAIPNEDRIKGVTQK